jgi:fatty acid/phospholipid biosynthesis enzyme
MRIAVDATGTDNTPRVVVQGAFEAVSELGRDIALVANKVAISETPK